MAAFVIPLLAVGAGATLYHVGKSTPRSTANQAGNSAATARKKQPISNFAKWGYRASNPSWAKTEMPAYRTGVERDAAKQANQINGAIKQLQERLATSRHPEWTMRYRRALGLMAVQKAHNEGDSSVYEIADTQHPGVGNVRDPKMNVWAQTQAAFMQRFTVAYASHKGDIKASAARCRPDRHTGPEVNKHIDNLGQPTQKVLRGINGIIMPSVQRPGGFPSVAHGDTQTGSKIPSRNSILRRYQ